MLIARTALAGEDPVSERVATARGFSLHAGVSCEAHQQELRERLCPYVPPDTIGGGRVACPKPHRYDFLLTSLVAKAPLRLPLPRIATYAHA